VEPQQDRTTSENDLTARLKRAEEALRSRELTFQLIVDSIPAPVAVITPTGEVEALNQPVFDYFGKSFEELADWANSDPVHPDDLPHVIDIRQKALERGETYEVESRHRRADGVYRWFHVRGFPLKDADGRILRWCFLLTDIDDRKRAEAQLAGEKRLLEMVASSSPLTDVLTALCKFVEDTSADCHCGIYLIDWSARKFRVGAVPSLPATFNDPVEGLTVSPEVGPCGVAALTKTQVIARDLESDPLWKSCAIRPLALAHGIRSHWTTPIYARDGQVLGTFAIFHRDPASPTQVQQDLIAQVTHIASIAIERSLSEAALKRSEAFLAEAQQLSRIGSFAWRVATNEITWSEQLYRIFEFDPQVTITLELIGTRVHPEDQALLNDMIERARSAASDFQYEHRLLMPDHSIKYLHLIAHGTRNEDGELEYIGAIQDVTARRLSEEALGKARSELAHMARVMSLGAFTAPRSRTK
jgi:PAS domain S-box-containing protein